MTCLSMSANEWRTWRSSSRSDRCQRAWSAWAMTHSAICWACTKASIVSIAPVAITWSRRTASHCSGDRSPTGRPFSHAVAQALALESHLVLVCGRYEGIDERVRLATGAEEISIGDFVLTGGEIAAMVVLDAVIRLLSGVLTSSDAWQNES